MVVDVDEPSEEEDGECTVGVAAVVVDVVVVLLGVVGRGGGSKFVTFLISLGQGSNSLPHMSYMPSVGWAGVG